MPDQLFSQRQLAYLNPWFKDVSHARMESLGVTGGFSGAVIWRVSVADRDLCLRRWPQAHPSLTGLLAIHGLLQHVATAGFDLVPVPLATRSGETHFVHEDHLWELTPWLPGEASLASDPSSAKLAAAMHALARFHQAAQAYGSGADGDTRASSCQAPSPGLQQRLQIIKSLLQGELQQLWHATRAAEASDLRELAFELLDGSGRSLEAVASNLEQIVSVPLPLQWCLRDVRHDHVLFSTAAELPAAKVCGLLDFGAVAVDSVAGDVARLLGSIANEQTETWQAGIAAYSQQRVLSPAEQRAIAGFDQGGLLCSATNWVRWLFVEGRAFPQIHALHAQLLWLRDRLQTLAAGSGASVGQELAGPAGRPFQEKSQQEQAPRLDASRESSPKHPKPKGPTAIGRTQQSNVSPWMHT